MPHRDHPRHRTPLLQAREGHGHERPRYCRATQLARLIPLWPQELKDYSPAGTARIVALLHRALRAERQRGRGGHWAYDLNRHKALLDCLKAEKAALRRLRNIRLHPLLPDPPQRRGSGPNPAASPGTLPSPLMGEG